MKKQYEELDGTSFAFVRCGHRRTLHMSIDATPANKAKELQKLAEEAKINAETTADPNRRRALRMTALKYKRLANFVDAKSR
jgi:hypothetical protein